VPPDPYRDALSRLYELVRFGEKPGLDGPRALDAALGHPTRRLRSVVIGGTNGKGSTAAGVEALLRDAGVRTGLFTSPHLVSFRERIRIDGVEVGEAAVARLADRVLGAAARAGYEASFFEVTWAMAAQAFVEAGVEVAVWEVGLGGRLDATNAVEPEVSAVVEIGLDHTAVLGPDLASIAREKAAIFRAGRPALTAATGAGLAALRGALPPGVALTEAAPHAAPATLPGPHQARNAGLALAIARALGVEPRPAALDAVRWPGRAERLGDVIIDCAHNPQAMAALAAWIAEAEPRPVHVVFGAMADKDAAGMAAALRPVAEAVTLVTPQYPRRAPAESLRPVFAAAGHERLEVRATAAEALAARPRGRTTLVAGSCFLAGEARAWLTGVEYPERGLLTLAR
jgi:dihydrofolate synthase/folylpolyglutamate synthase